MDAPTDASALDPALVGADPTTGVADPLTPLVPRQKPPGYEEAVHARRLELESEYDQSRQKQGEIYDKIASAEDDLATTEANQDKALQEWYQNNYPKGDVNPPEYKPITMDDVRGNLIPMLIAATIAGKGSRQHYMGAMNAYASMLKGADEGRKEAFEAAKTKFDGQMKVLQDNQKAFTQQFNAIVANNKATLAQKEHAIKMLEMQYGKQVQENSDLNRAIDRTYMEDQNFQKMVKSSEQFKQKLAATVAKNNKDTEVGFTPEALDMEAIVVLENGGKPPPSFGMKGRSQQVAILNHAAAMAKDLDIKPEDIPAMGASFQANLGSLKNQTKAKDAVSQYYKSFDNNIQTWRETAAGMDPSILAKTNDVARQTLQQLNIHGDINDTTNITAWNNAILSMKKSIGDPQAVAYLTATMTVAMDYSRIMAGGASGSIAQTAEGARKDALDLIDAGLAPEAREKQVNILRAEATGKIKGMSDQIQETKDRMRLAAKTKTIQPSADHAADGWGPVTVVPAPTR